MGRCFAGPGESLSRFRRAIAARGHQRIAIGDLQLQPPTLRHRPFRARRIRHLDRLAQMRDSLLERRATQGEIACLAPIFDRRFNEAGLREVVGEQFRLGIDDGREFFAQGLGDATVQDLPAAPQEALVGSVLNQRVLERV